MIIMSFGFDGEQSKSFLNTGLSESIVKCTYLLDTLI